MMDAKAARGRVTMRFVAISRRSDGFDPARAAALAGAEARAVWEAYGDGLIEAFHFDADPLEPRGILMLEAESREAAQALLATLPLVSEGHIGFDVHALGPYRGLAAAFAPQ
jgi:hypothetical protein